MGRKKLLLTFSPLVAGVLVLPACGNSGNSGNAGASAAAPSPAPQLSAQTKTLVTQAKTEGTLTVIDPLPGGSKEMAEWAKGFNTYYGLNTKVKYVPGFNIPQTAATLGQEQQASRPASTDVFVGSQTHTATLLQYHALTTEPWDKLGNIPAGAVQGDGSAVAFETRLPGITYNTDKLKNPPKTLQDVLKGNYVIGTTPYGSNFTDLASDKVWGQAKTLQYVQSLAAKAKGLIGCGDEERVATGEFTVFAIDCGANHGLVKQGAPIGHVIPTDGALESFFWGSVPKNAAHPANAQLFINYLLTHQAQQVLYQYEGADLSLLSGSKTAQEMKQSGANFTLDDINFAQANSKVINGIRGQFQGILAQVK